jgi:two-component system chemotaxis response regulator CheB
VILPGETRAKIGVLIVDRSAFMRESLARIIRSDPALFVVGTARSGADALDKIPALQPDVVTLDVEIGGLDTLETLRGIMARFPRPVLMVSSVTVKGAEVTFEALQAGAFDYVPKQVSSSPLDIIHIRHELIAKIKTAADSHGMGAFPPLRKPPQAASPAWDTFARSPAIIAIGTSTGGPKALQDILTQFPSDFPVPILIVQHMPAGFTKPFAERLNTLCPVTVKEAVHREPLRPGVVYIAPAGIHMTVERPSKVLSIINLSLQPSDSLHIPSVDVTMESVAMTFGNSAMGVIMTGMGSDGALGMTAIHRAGGITLGQDEASSIVYGMPRVCAELGILNLVVPLAEIPQQIVKALRYRKRA